MFNSETAKLAKAKQKRGSNRISTDLKEKISGLLSKYSVEEMVEDLHALRPKDRLWILNGLCEYVIPKLQRSEVNQTTTLDLSLLNESELELVASLTEKLEQG